MKRKEWLQLTTFGNSSEQSALRDVVELELCSLTGGNVTKIEAYVVPVISNIKNVHVDSVKCNYSHLQGLWFSDADQGKSDLEITVLIGADYLWQYQGGCVIRGRPDEPVAVQTSLGWVLSGPIKGRLNDTPHGAARVNTIRAEIQEGNLDSEICKLWDLETIGIRPKDEVSESFQDNIVFNGVRYTVRLPWKVSHEALPTNYTNSLARLKGLLVKLRKDEEVLKECQNIIDNQLETGVIEKVVDLETEDNCHYLPHRPVVRHNAETTKVRMVFDASSKTGKKGISLNDCLHVGPSLNPLLYDILLRFRMAGVAMTADIEKAFLNIEVDKADRDSLRFLWATNPFDDNPPVETYQFCRVVFGVKSSPFLLNGTLRYHLQNYEKTDPLFVQQMIDSLYVDDMVFSTSTLECAYGMYEKAKERMMSGGSRLRKWVTNNQELAERIKCREESRERNCDSEKQSEESYAKATLGFTGEPSMHKVLGLDWNFDNDTVLFDFKPILKKAEAMTPTKREVLSLMAGVFDPLGLISPVQLSMKVLFQQLCKENVGWDDELEGPLKLRWESWIKSLSKAGGISIERFALQGSNEGETIQKGTLHGFCDASKDAYCAMVYVVYETSEGLKASLLTSKTRVAPLKPMTIPRLELMAARILAQLMETAKEAIKSHIEITDCYYWSDSMTALQWIQNKGEWKQFVRSRVNEILGATKKDRWRHCPGEINPADIGSRGMKAEDLKDSKLWWEGPQFLTDPSLEWPEFMHNEEDLSESVECERKVTTLAVQAKEIQNVGNVIDINRYSSVLKLLRVTALVIRFVRNLSAKRRGSEKIVGNLGREELFHAESLWIRSVQESLKQQKNYQQLVRELRVYEDDGILRARGRLNRSDLPQETKNPILLSRYHKFTEMIILDCHKFVHHSGVSATLTELRTRFWVLKGRQLVKVLLHRCVTCRRQEGKPYDTPVTADLPEFRVRQAPPFSWVGVDFAGPLLVKGLGGDMVKSYIALFTCCISRAVHLELVGDLGVPSFLRCFRRFTARRGTPVLMISDNAKTFKTTGKNLKQLYNHPEVRTELERKKVEWKLEWKFILERAPNWGGFYERLVGLTKRCLKKVLGNARLNHDELHTILVEIEGTLNARPLTYVGSELEREILTPAHLLYGRNINSLPDYPIEEEDFKEKDLGARYKYLTERLVHFWSRWKSEYLVNLREHHRSDSKVGKNFVRVGDIVLLGDDIHKKRNDWKLGVVQECIKGKDNEVRGAKVRVKGMKKPLVLSRPVQKLFPIEVRNENEQAESQSREFGGPALDASLIAPSRPARRAAALDSQWKTQGTLDSL